MRYIFYKFSIIVILIEVLFWLFMPAGLWSLVILGPILFLGYRDAFSDNHTVRKNFPVLGNLRYFFESIRPEIMQYFVETDTEGRPLNRIYRNLVYRRAKKVNDTTPFGTQGSCL